MNVISTISLLLKFGLSKFRRSWIFQQVAIPAFLHVFLSAKGVRHAKRAWLQPNGCLSCPNSMGLVHSTRVLSGLLYCHQAACPAVELCTNIINRNIQLVCESNTNASGALRALDEDLVILGVVDLSYNIYCCHSGNCSFVKQSTLSTRWAPHSTPLGVCLFKLLDQQHKNPSWLQLLHFLQQLSVR